MTAPEGEAGDGGRRSFPGGGGDWGGGDCRYSGVWSEAEAEAEGWSPDCSCNLAWSGIAPFVVLIWPFFFVSYWRLLLGF